MTEPTAASKPNATPNMGSNTTATTTKRSEQTGDLLLDLGLPDDSKSLQNKTDQDVKSGDDTATKRRSSRKSKPRQKESTKQQAELVAVESEQEPEADRTRQAHDPSFEQSIQQLSEIVEQLESGDLPLEQSVKLFEQGMEIVKRCDQQLKNAAQKVQKLIAVDDEGNAYTEPFDT